MIGTPGRILDMINEQALGVHTANVFVVDEADMTLDMGFWKKSIKLRGVCLRNYKCWFSRNDSREIAPILEKIHGQSIDRRNQIESSHL